MRDARSQSGNSPSRRRASVTALYLSLDALRKLGSVKGRNAQPHRGTGRWGHTLKAKLISHICQARPRQLYDLVWIVHIKTMPNFFRSKQL